MRTLFCFAIAFFLNFVANGQNPSYELDHTISIDTINKIDGFNQKQGKWVVRGKHLPKKAKKCFEMGQVIEKGVYLNNRKTGIWTEYYCNGKARSELTYVNGVLEGSAIFYNMDGSVLKKGSFRANKWVTVQ